MTRRSFGDQLGFLSWRKTFGSIPHVDTEAKTAEPQPSSTQIKLTENNDGLINGIGDYHLIKPLGTGKFSDVVLAKHYDTGRLVAIKIIDKRKHDYRVMSRLVREITLMELMNHEFVTKLHETYETADSLYLIMEYVPGVNLEQYLHLAGGALSECEARRLFQQIVAAVSYCHSRWIVHRDLKTPNILITPEGNVKLVDFGLGNRFGLQRLKTICGSMLYYSPEIISGQKYYGPEIDCWCLGIILFRMTTGFEPFSHANTVGELKADVCSGHFPMPSSLSPELQSTIRKCLSTDRRKRMTVRQVLKNDPWLYKGADTSDFMAKSSKADDACEILDRTEREHRLRRNFIADAEHDRMITHVNKTLIYHPVNASTYYTTSALPAAAGTEGGLEIMRAELLQDLRYHARRLGVQSINRTHIQKTPVIKKIVNHLRFNKNQFSDSSDMHAKGGLNSVERIYQRLTKIQTFEYKITGRESAQRFSSRMSSGTTQSFTSSSASASLDDNTFCSISKRYELEMTKLIRLACELFGVTFVHCHHNRLLCVVTMRNDGRKMSSLSTLMLQGDNSSTTTDSPTLVNQSMDDSDTEKQIYVGKRLSMPLAKKASSLTVEETNRRASMNIDRSLNKEHSGTCVFEVEVGVNPNHLATVNFIKQQGTTIVFKLVSGWIGTVLGLDS
ncbi:unnamed protein product [Umbelopsis sp. WA50703]